MQNFEKYEKIGVIGLLVFALSVLWTKTVQSDNDLRNELKSIKRDYLICNSNFTKLLIEKNRDYQVIISENTKTIESFKNKFLNENSKSKKDE